MKLRCLLVDDEPPALEVLQAYIREVTYLELAGCCGNALEAFAALQSQAVDLLFLDIKMPKMLGTDFLRSLRNPPKVIFTTAYATRPRLSSPPPTASMPTRASSWTPWTTCSSPCRWSGF